MPSSYRPAELTLPPDLQDSVKVVVPPAGNRGDAERRRGRIDLALMAVGAALSLLTRQGASQPGKRELWEEPRRRALSTGEFWPWCCFQAEAV